MTKFGAIGIVLAMVLASPLSYARAVYLNGVDISQVRNQKFRKATITIDANGDIRIDAPGYQVEVVEPVKGCCADTLPPSQGGPNPLLSKRYYLTSQPSPNGRAQYDFYISVNGVDYKTIKADAPQIIMEISAWLHRGDNEIVITAKKNVATGRKSFAETDQARLIVGLGHEEGKTVRIDNVKADVKVSAAEITNLEKHFVITAE